MKDALIPVELLETAEWNPNVMDEAMRRRLTESIERFGMVGPIVVRKIGDLRYETIAGADRLEVSRNLGFMEVHCMHTVVQTRMRFAYPQSIFG